MRTNRYTRKTLSGQGKILHGNSLLFIQKKFNVFKKLLPSGFLYFGNNFGVDGKHRHIFLKLGTAFRRSDKIGREGIQSRKEKKIENDRSGQIILPSRMSIGCITISLPGRVLSYTVTICSITMPNESVTKENVYFKDICHSHIDCISSFQLPL